MHAKLLLVPVALLALGCSPLSRDLPPTSSNAASGGGGHPTGSGTGAAAGTGTGATSTGTGTGGGTSAGTGGTMGTGGGSTTPPPFVDGTRLQAVVQDGGGGAVSFQHWQDTVLNAPCQFLPTTDGDFHCLPIQNNTIGYSDSACTTLVGVMSTCGATSNYVIDQPQVSACEQSIFGSGSAGQATIYTIGSMAGTGQVYTRQGTNCYATGSTTPYYNVNVAPLSGFVGATPKQFTGDARLNAEQLLADDGSSQITGDIYDKTKGDTACSLSLTGDPNLPDFYCVPGVLAQIEPSYPQYADSACTQLVAEDYAPSTCPLASVAVENQNQTQCNLGTSTFYTPAMNVSAGDICQLEGTPQTCDCQPNTGGNRYYTLGAAIDSSTFAKLKIGFKGTGRLQTITLTTQEGNVLTNAFPSTFWDTTIDPPMGTACQVLPFSDGKQRCVISTAINNYAGNTPVYGDPSCSQPVASTSVDPTCPAPAPTSIVTLTQGQCSPQNGQNNQTVTATNAVGAMASPASLYTLDPAAGCLSYSPYSNTDYYFIGAVIDPSTIFAQVTEKAE